jgi:hypothetical protein
MYELLPVETQVLAKKLFASFVLQYNEDNKDEMDSLNRTFGGFNFNTDVKDDKEDNTTWYSFNGGLDLPFESPDGSENPFHVHKFHIGIWATYVVPHQSKLEEKKQTCVLWSLFVGEKCEYLLYCGGFSYLLKNMPFPKAGEVVEAVKKNVKEVFSLPF